MHMKLILTAILIFYASASKLQAQADSLPGNAPAGYAAEDNYRTLGSPVTNETVRTFDNRYQGVKGSPFLNVEWVRGRVILRDSSQVQELMVRFNAKENELHYLNQHSKEMIAEKSALAGFVIFTGNTSRIFTLLPPSDPDKAKYYEQLSGGRVSLLELHSKEFLKADYQGGYSANRPYDEFIDKSALYWFAEGMSKPEKLKTGYKNVMKCFPDMHGELDAYIKEKGIRLNVREGIIEVFKLYNTL